MTAHRANLHHAVVHRDPGLRPGPDAGGRPGYGPVADWVSCCLGDGSPFPRGHCAAARPVSLPAVVCARARRALIPPTRLTLAAPPRPAPGSRATFYGTDAWSIHAGSCGYGQLAEDVGTGWDVAALSDAVYDYKGSCGCARALAGGTAAALFPACRSACPARSGQARHGQPALRQCPARTICGGCVRFRAGTVVLHGGCLCPCWAPAPPGHPLTHPTHPPSHPSRPRSKCKEVRCKASGLKDGYGAWLDRAGVCFDTSASVVVMITDTCPCSYPGNAYSNKRWCCGDM